jgi:two-component system NtrC family sensor kinase
MCVLGGGLSLGVGVRLLNGAVFSEAYNRIRLDLNAAREIYNNVGDRVALALKIAAEEEVFQRAAGQEDLEVLRSCIGTIAQEARMDFAGIITHDGSPLLDPEDIPNPAALYSLRTRQIITGTIVLDSEQLRSESPDLAARAAIRLVDTPRARPRGDVEETSGLVIISAVPVYDANTLVCVLYGGVLLNRSTEIVDRVKETVFLNEVYDGRSIGTATIFFKDLRISTNVLAENRTRAIGTRVSEEVYEKVLEEGERWTDRAFVVNDWYITAYEPIEDIYGRRVGILYAGVLEEKYVDIRRRTILTFVIITSSGVLVAVLLGFLLGQRILQPIQRLVETSRRISAGDLSVEIGPIASGEIGMLQKTFAEMVSSLRARDLHLKAESERKLLQSEKEASAGRLAAGVAHEINNPLTGVVTFTHMLLKRDDLPPGVREDLETISAATDRVRKIVKGLLDFTRQSKLDPEMMDINALIEETIPLVANQALVKGVIFCFYPGEDIPQRVLDRNQFQSVILNIIINALDATEAGGHINISSRLAVSAGESPTKGVEIEISDTGHGIAAEDLDRLFDPFFTTKEVGKGTGLGLSVTQGIVERHAGTIRVQSTVGKGTTFTIWLPTEGEVFSK